MKNRSRVVFLGLAILIISTIISYNLYDNEVVDEDQFTEYYDTNESDNGGWAIENDNFTVISKEYNLVIKNKEPEEKKSRIPEKQEYQIQKGDTLKSIANKFGISIETIKVNNPKISSKSLKVGEKVVVLNENGVFYKIQKGDTLSKIGLLFKVKPDEIKKINQLSKNSLKVGQVIYIANPDYKNYFNKEKEKERKKEIAKGNNGETSTTGFSYPVKFAGISSPFGYRFHPILNRYILHSGADFKAKFVPLYAVKEGVVTFAGVQNGYGKIIIIQHVGGIESRYAHLDKIGVKKGDRVKKGELIGKTGQSGRVTGPHLHFEIRVNGKPVNPMKYFK